MDEGIAGTVAEWEERPFDGGTRELRDLADREFSGAVAADGTWLLLINGRGVGVFEEYDGPDGPEQEPGDVDRLVGATGTIYEAPHEGLPLLYAMMLSGGRERGRYYTGERPLGETHRELESGGFTGYVELSEEVVSGDYYVVYQGGRSMSVAFLGGERRLLTDDEALERADQEVGIYTVQAVDVDVVDLPEPAEGSEPTGGVASGGPSSDDAGQPAAPSSPDGTEPSGGGATDGAAPTSRSGGEDPSAGSPGGSGGPDSAAEDGAPPGSAGPVEGPGDGSAGPPDEGDAGSTASGGAGTGGSPADGDSSIGDGRAADGAAGADASADGNDGGPAGQTSSSAGAESGAEGPAAGASGRSVDGDPRDGPTSGRPPSDEIGRLEARVDALAAEQERLAAALDELRAGATSGDVSGAAHSPSTALDPGSALSETTLLVRYRADGGPTLEGLGGGLTREAHRENLQLEVRAPFDPDEATVEARPYRSFLRESLEYRFAEWLVAELPFDVREGNAATSLRPLYEALPAIDRVTFGGAASVDDESFDLVAWTRESDPVVVATFEDGSQPPTEAATEAFVKSATAVAEENPSLAAAALVTSAFVDGAALGPAREATRSSLLGRNRRKSFVRLSGGGYHLCLVEAGDSFHLARPEL